MSLPWASGGMFDALRFPPLHGDSCCERGATTAAWPRADLTHDPAPAPMEGGRARRSNLAATQAAPRTTGVKRSIAGGTVNYEGIRRWPTTMWPSRFDCCPVLSQPRLFCTKTNSSALYIKSLILIGIVLEIFQKLRKRLFCVPQRPRSSP